MREPHHTIGQGDRLPALRVILQSAAGTVIVASAVTFDMRRRGVGGALVVDGQAATEIDADAGIWEYQWAAGDTDVSGDYKAVFVATVAGLQLTFPNTDEALWVRITPATGE